MTQQANCKITAHLDNGDLFEENVSVIWINDKTGAVTVKLKSGAYHRFPIERVMRLEWITPARVVQRWSDRGTIKLWGFDTPEGFASFGPTEQDRQLAKQCCEMYNTGECRQWNFLPIHEYPICDQTQQPPSD